MAHRAVLTARQRAALFDLPTDEASLLRYYTLDDEDIEHIGTRRRPENQLGFALQLCAFRYPGRLLKAGEVIPEPVSRFVAAQLGLKSDDLLPYAARQKDAELAGPKCRSRAIQSGSGAWVRRRMPQTADHSAGNFGH